MDYLSSILFLFLLGRTSSQGTESEEGRNEGIICFEQIIQDGDLTNLLIDVTTQERVNHFCWRHSELQRCTRQNEHFMSVQENTEYLKKTSGVHSFYVNVCPPGTDITAEYKGNAPCFKFIKNDILSCGSDLPDLDSYKMKKDLRTRCCALKNHRECLKKVAAEHCGNEAASVIEKIHFRYFDSKAKECNTTSFNCAEDNSIINDQTTVGKWNGPSTRLHFPSSREYEYHTEQNCKSTTISDWRRSSHHDEWKKHKHNDGVSLTAPSIISLLSSLVSLLLLKL